MSFARLPWIVAAFAIVVAGLLGWAYASAKDKARAFEAEWLKAKGLIVTEVESRRQVEKTAERLASENAGLKAEIQRAAKLIPGATVDAANHIVTEVGTVGGEGRHPKPTSTTPRSPRVSPPGTRPPARRPTSSGPAAWQPRGIVAAAQTEAIQGGARPDEAGLGVVGGAARGAAGERGGAREGTREAAPEGECVLAAGDKARIVVDEVQLRTEAGNQVVVGGAKLNRVEPEPATTVFAAKFAADGSKLVRVARKDEKDRGLGLGVGVTGWDGGVSVGPVLASPSFALLGHSLEGSVTVGFGSKLIFGAQALTRF